LNTSSTGRRRFFRFAAAFSTTGLGVAGTSAWSQTSAGCPALLQHSVPRLQDDAPQALCQFAGRVLLIVNTASRCGFTPQYEGLEVLHARFASRGFTVLGFPSNDFGQQEPGSAQQIAELCFNTYGVRFPMFSKTAVSGAQAHPLWRQLAQASGRSPRWNFHKYLVARDGRTVSSFDSNVEPMAAALTQAVERALAARG
jgi:glutathione peroxidase